MGKALTCNYHFLLWEVSSHHIFETQLPQISSWPCLFRGKGFQDLESQTYLAGQMTKTEKSLKHTWHTALVIIEKSAKQDLSIS